MCVCVIVYYRLLSLLIPFPGKNSYKTQIAELFFTVNRTNEYAALPNSTMAIPIAFNSVTSF